MLSGLCLDVYSKIFDQLSIEDVQAVSFANKSLNRSVNEYFDNFSARKVSLHYFEYLKTRYHPSFRYSVTIGERNLREMVLLSGTEDRYVNLFNGIEELVVQKKQSEYEAKILTEDIETFLDIQKDRPPSRETLKSLVHLGTKWNNSSIGIKFRKDSQTSFVTDILRKELDFRLFFSRKVTDNIFLEMFDQIEEMSIDMECQTLQRIRYLKNIRKLRIKSSQVSHDGNLSIGKINAAHFPRESIDVEELVGNHPLLESLELLDVSLVRNINFITGLKKLRRLRIMSTSSKSEDSYSNEIDWFEYLLKKINVDETSSFLERRRAYSDATIEFLVPGDFSTAKLVSFGIQHRSPREINPSEYPYRSRNTEEELISFSSLEEVTISNFTKGRHDLVIDGLGRNITKLSIVGMYAFEAEDYQQIIDIRNLPIKSLQYDLNNRNTNIFRCNLDLIETLDLRMAYCHDKHIGDILRCQMIDLTKMTRLKKLTMNVWGPDQKEEYAHPIVPAGVTDLTFHSAYGRIKPQGSWEDPGKRDITYLKEMVRLISNPEGLISFSIELKELLLAGYETDYDVPAIVTGYRKGFHFPHGLDWLINRLDSIVNLRINIPRELFVERSSPESKRFSDLKFLKNLDIGKSYILLEREDPLFLRSLTTNNTCLFMNCSSLTREGFIEKLKRVAILNVQNINPLVAPAPRWGCLELHNIPPHDFIRGFVWLSQQERFDSRCRIIVDE